jgi:transcriptional regulator with PAS, ATPase and Fis domain
MFDSGFVKKYSREFKKDVRGVSQGALPALEAYDWPGNVRELENVIERSVAPATRPVSFPSRTANRA